MFQVRLMLRQVFFWTATFASTLHATSAESQWKWLNYNASTISPIREVITIHAPPDTDIWRPSINNDNFTAPYLYTSIETSNFQSVNVTVQANWKTLYDQGGLVITFPERQEHTYLQWIKAGVEFTDGAPYLGVVGTDRLSDWSLSPMLQDSNTGNATIEIVRDGSDAWVYVIEGTRRRSLRQVTWAFNEGNSEHMHVGIYAAKPTRESGVGHEFDTLAVTFKLFSLETKS
ncbi:hypothetical protein N7532_000869 [Penicillium argentinense]|uniref:Uncharacterized protein n=1 Tax=Penicillium argentinense TaxID=1131581 RepID=A0A9W9G5Z8_9EURO|nr:uncharacterized protein N7532_000869 [Penicillium argentinense]KAJ5112824.1 hypothetical protein N7532_000869 [Penicillium argentinense]